MNLIYTNTLQKSPAILFPYKPPYIDAYHRIGRENTLAAHYNGFREKNRQNEHRSPPPLEKISVKSSQYQSFTSPTQHHTLFNYGLPSSRENSRDSKPTHDELLKSRYHGTYPEITRSIASYDPFHSKLSISQQETSSERRSAISHSNATRTLSKARMKYTPVREDMHFKREPVDYEMKDKRMSAPNNFPVKHLNNFKEKSHDTYPNKSQSSYHPTDDSSKPYYRVGGIPNEQLFRRESGRYDVETSIKQEYSKYHQRRLSESLSESSRNNNSAFSVIRPHFHRMYSTESGYSSDPSSGNPFKSVHSLEKSEILSRRQLNSASSAPLPTNGYNNIQVKSPNRDFKNGEAVNKLHISDEASKEALKAFDAHVEKIIAESRGRQSQDQGSTELSASSMNQTDRQLASHAMTTSSGYVVQCSTVDSTQTSEAAYGSGGLLGLTRVANEHLGQAIAKERKRSKSK